MWLTRATLPDVTKGGTTDVFPDDAVYSNDDVDASHEAYDVGRLQAPRFNPRVKWSNERNADCVGFGNSC